MVAARAHENDVRASTVVAAMRLFAAHGFEGTALQDIADAVGVSKPAVLHHFPSKEHVRQAVLDEILSHWNEALPRLLLAATGSGDRFDAVFGELYRFFSNNPDRARVVAREMLDRPGELRKLLRGSVKPWLGAVAGYIRAGKERGLHYADVDEEAYLIHILLLVITATASATVTSSALETDPRARHDRYDRELARIARASLFPSAASASAASASAPSASASSAQSPKKAAGEARKRKVSR
jgi:TetR/AcrR family transcriptional regulator